MTPLTRRDLLRLALGAGLAGPLGLLRALAAAAPAASGYRALVCVFLAGGNDAFNTLVPTDSAGWADYQRARGPLALARDTLVPLAGSDYGLHPAAAGLADPWAAGELAVVANVGPLVEPVTRAQVRAGTAPLPPQLFSHNDQQRLWMLGDARGTLRSGWAGRLADWLAAQGQAAAPGVNYAFGPANLWQSGAASQPYGLTDDGPVTLAHLSDPRGAPLRGPFAALARAGLSHPNRLLQTWAARELDALDHARQVADALAGVTLPEPLAHPFPDHAFGRQLRTVARLIAARDALGQSRQIFFLRLGGWDTHADQTKRHRRLLDLLTRGLLALREGLQGLGVYRQVVTFTMSDFGRTLSSNGDGTDHGWGGHALVLGGAVQGGLVGTMPTLALDGPDDSGHGRLIPTTASVQYAATLARWFGLDETTLDTLFPTLARFSPRDLGFLSAA